MTSNLIITRHAGAVEWLKTRHGVEGEVTAHATAELVRGKRVFGILPLGLAAECESVVSIDVPNLPAEKRGQELTPEEMDAFGAKLVEYVVRRKD